MNVNLMKIIKEYDLFIFDLDDTLVMTEKYHNKAWNRALTEELKIDIEFDFKTYCSIFHSNVENYFKNYLNEKYGINNFIDLCNKKNKIYFELIKDDIPKLNDGAENFINEIIKNNKKFVIVSNTTLENINFFIDKYPILNNCDKIFHRDMFKNKKPHSECYIYVRDSYPNMKMIGFEDSITGIHALYNVKEITPYFVNNKEYYHYDYIIDKYEINYIKNLNF